MDNNQPKDIMPKKNGDRLSKPSELAKRGLQMAQSPTRVHHSSSLSQFLDSIGGIPDNNKDMRFREINEALKNYFSKMSMDEISKELEIEFQKRPNGRTLKLLGFSCFHRGRLDDAIEALTSCLEITSEDPVAVYEVLGRCYILKGDQENAKQWYAESYRYDFDFFLEVFGWDFLYVTAVGDYRLRPPIFGAFADNFSAKAGQMEIMADVIGMVYGNKKGHKSLLNAQDEHIVLNMIKEYTANSLKVIEDTKAIKEMTSQLVREMQESDALKHDLDILNAIQKSEKEKEQVKKLLSEGKNFQQKGETQHAIVFYEKALIISDELDYKFGKGSALGYLGLAHNQMGNLQLAVEYLNKALIICRLTGNQRDIATNLVNLGKACQSLGELQRAIDYYGEALAIDRQIGDQREVASDLYLLGWANGSMDNHHRAIEYLDEALTIFRKLEDVNGVVSCLVGLAGASAEINEYKQAISLANEAVILGEKTKHPLTQTAKEFLAIFRKAHKEAIDQAYQAFLDADTPLDMERVVIHFPFLVDDEFINQLKNIEMPASLDFDTRFSRQLYFSKKAGWLEQIACEEQFVSTLIDLDEEVFDADCFQTRCLRTYIPTMVLSPKHELGFQAFLCTRSISELKKIVKNFPYMLSDSSFITGTEHVIQSLPSYEHPEALRERLNALRQLTKK